MLDKAGLFQAVGKYLIVAIAFITIAVFIASKIQVGGASVAIPGMPDDTHPMSLLEAIWTYITNWFGG